MSSDLDFPGDSSGPKKRRPFWLSAAVSLLLCLFAAAVVAGGVVYHFLNKAPETPGRDVEILIPKGTSFAALAAQLKARNAITGERAFRLLAHFTNRAEKVRSGRFMVNTGWKPGRLLDHLIEGKPILERITLPEGLTMREIGRRLEGGGFVRMEDFEAVVRDPHFLRHWGIPFDSAEGFLFPDTYLLMRPLTLDRASAAEVVGRLVDTFWRRSAPIWPEGRRPGPENAGLVRRLVTLASIVEKETGVEAERRRVAGVYVNRLQRGMLLQADPTVIYGRNPSISGALRRSDLNNEANLYNTYKHKGLPPGPICSPGLASLRAAGTPEKHNYLFFVARGDGSHTFSITLAEHNRAVRLYRQHLRRGDSSVLLPGGAAPAR